jgi:hypothetical protein
MATVDTAGGTRLGEALGREGDAPGLGERESLDGHVVSRRR